MPNCPEPDPIKNMIPDAQIHMFYNPLQLYIDRNFESYRWGVTALLKEYLDQMQKTVTNLELRIADEKTAADKAVLESQLLAHRSAVRKLHDISMQTVKQLEAIKDSARLHATNIYLKNVCLDYGRRMWVAVAVADHQMKMIVHSTRSPLQSDIKLEYPDALQYLTKQLTSYVNITDNSDVRVTKTIESTCKLFKDSVQNLIQQMLTANNEVNGLKQTWARSAALDESLAMFEEANHEFGHVSNDVYQNCNTHFRDTNTTYESVGWLFSHFAGLFAKHMNYINLMANTVKERLYLVNFVLSHSDAPKESVQSSQPPLILQPLQQRDRMFPIPTSGFQIAVNRKKLIDAAYPGRKYTHK